MDKPSPSQSLDLCRTTTMRSSTTTASSSLPRSASNSHSYRRAHSAAPWTASPNPSEYTAPCSPTPSSVNGSYATDATSPPASTAGEDENECDGVAAMRAHKIYLDTGGSMLYAQSLIQRFASDLTSNLYGNPHSASTPSALAGHRVDAIREKTLRFFNADPEQWDLVFTANASGAIKLVVECMRDHAAATNTPLWYGYHKDAHTSLVGVRELVSTHRCFVNDDEVEKWISSGGFGGARSRETGLFAYPGQSNMTGRRLPLSWCDRIRKDVHRARTYTLLDAAALVSTAKLDLSDASTAPDFIAMSFYKIFGFPNVGALLVRRDSQHVLEGRRFFGGGTVDMVVAVKDTWHAMKDTRIHERLEDGTLPFHSIFALDHAIDVHEELYGPDPMKFISEHTACLAKQLFDGISGLRHANGQALAIVYSDPGTVYGDSQTQGATIAFNVQQADGEAVGYEVVEKAADARGIYVRSGSLCNPGGMATYLDWSPAEMRAAYAAGHRCSTPQQTVLGKPTGVVRVSLGAMNIQADVNAFINFLKETYIDHDPNVVVKARTTRPESRLLASSAPVAKQEVPTEPDVRQQSKRRFGRGVASLLGKRSSVRSKRSSLIFASDK